MKFTLNPYALVIENEGVANFILSDYSNPIKITLNNNQAGLLARMHDQDFCDYEELCNVFDKSFIDILVQNGILVPATLDTISMHSRTNAFFATHNMP